MESVADFKLMRLLTCPACGQNQRKLIVQINSSAVYECSHCTLRYLDPCLDPASMSKVYESDSQLVRLHDFHEGYFDYGSLDKKSRTARDFQRALKLMDPYAASSKSQRHILDIGCGNGFFLEGLLHSVVGITPDIAHRYPRILRLMLYYFYQVPAAFFG